MSRRPRAIDTRLPGASHPLLARGHSEDPEVRDAEVGLVVSLPPCLLVADELAQEARLREPIPRDRHGAPVGFEEEECVPPVLRRVLEAKAEDPIGFHSQAVRLAAMADLDLPAEGQAQPPGFCRRRGEHLLGRDELHPLAAPAGDLEGDHDLGYRERVVEENPGDVPVLRVPPDAAPPYLSLRLEDLRAAVPQGIDQRFGAAGVPVELHGRAVEIAVVKEELQAPERRLPASI